LAGLKAQTLPTADWELLLIDNASKEPLAKSWDVSWHPQGRHLREERLGSAQAHLCGIRESDGELLVFIDDDTVLSPDYLSVAIDLARQYTQLGAFGASFKGEFEEPPPAWLIPYLPSFVSELDDDHWSNSRRWSAAFPYGAGLCIRRRVAEDYERKAHADARRTTLGRIGTGLGGAEDVDLAQCAIDIGMGTGRFRALQLTHLIPARKLTKEYIVKMMAGNAASLEILASFRPRENPKAHRHERLRFLWSLLEGSAIDRRILWASRRERKKAREFLAGQTMSSPSSASAPHGPALLKP
jgi:glycosyltransferase involved in cell wall biosynthesis